MCFYVSGAPRGAKSMCFYVSGAPMGAPRGAKRTCFYVSGALPPSKNGSKRLEIAIFRWVFVSFLKMGVFSKRLAPLTRQTGKTSRTKRKTSKTLRNIEIFGFWGVLKKRLSTDHQNAPSPTKKHTARQKSQFSFGFLAFVARSGTFFFLSCEGCKTV